MSSATITLDQDVWKPKFNPWLIAVVVALGAFMERPPEPSARTAQGSGLTVPRFHIDFLGRYLDQLSQCSGWIDQVRLGGWK